MLEELDRVSECPAAMAAVREGFKGASGNACGLRSVQLRQQHSGTLGARPQVHGFRAPAWRIDPVRRLDNLSVAKTPPSLPANLHGCSHVESHEVSGPPSR